MSLYVLLWLLIAAAITVASLIVAHQTWAGTVDDPLTEQRVRDNAQRLHSARWAAAIALTSPAWPLMVLALVCRGIYTLTGFVLDGGRVGREGLHVHKHLKETR